MCCVPPAVIELRGRICHFETCIQHFVDRQHGCEWVMWRDGSFHWFKSPVTTVKGKRRWKANTFDDERLTAERDLRFGTFRKWGQSYKSPLSGMSLSLNQRTKYPYNWLAAATDATEAWNSPHKDCRREKLPRNPAEPTLTVSSLRRPITKSGPLDYLMSHDLKWLANKKMLALVLKVRLLHLKSHRTVIYRYVVWQHFLVRKSRFCRQRQGPLSSSEEEVQCNWLKVREITVHVRA